MNLKELLAKLLQERDELVAKAAAAGGLDEAGAQRAIEIAEEHKRLTALLAQQDAANAALAQIPTVEVHEPEQPTDRPTGRTLGERFVASAGYRDFQSQHPHGIADGTPISIRMAATINRQATGVEGVLPEWTDDLTYRPPRTLMDLITTGTTGKSYLPYRQLIAVTNNAAIVAEAKDNAGTGTTGGVKPLSTLTFAPAEAKVADYADGMEVTNQELEDDGAIKALIDSNLTANLHDRIQDKLLNGTGVGIEPKGLFNITGVQQQAFATDMPTTIRKTITKLRNVGASVQAVLLNPADDEAWDLLKDGEGRYLGGGPFGVSPATAWAVPRIGCNAVPIGKALLGNFKTIHFLTRSPIEILVFNQHKDYAQRNLNYVRAETRAMQMFRAPGHLAIADLVAGG